MEGWIAILVGGILLFLWGYGDMVADSRKVAERSRDMLHKERVMAMEKGLPPPDGSFDEALLAYVAEGPQERSTPAGSWARTIGWAIVLIFGGVGWIVASLLVPKISTIGWVHDTFGFGIVPVLLGLGMLLQAWLLRSRN